MGFGSNYTGNPVAVQAPSPAPGPGVAPIMYLPSDLDGATWANLLQEIKTGADFLAWITKTGLLVSRYGDGSDGAAVLDGTNTFSWASKVGNVYSLTRSVYLTNLTLTGATISLKSQNFGIFVSDTLTTNGGKITSNGGTTFTAVFGGRFIGGSNGGTPAGVGAGPAGSTQSAATFSGQGGAGGTGAGGAGGAGGSLSLALSDTSPLRAYTPATLGTFLSLGVWVGYGGGSGGGAGGGSGGATGVVGGSGAGVLGIAARAVVLNDGSDLQAAGTAGVNAVNNNTGGGGGGGGGTLVLVTSSLTNPGAAISSALCCPGGTGGTGLGTGTSGSAGATGTAIAMVQLS